MNISSRQLTVLKSVMKTQSTVLSAQALGVSQSQVSRTIQQIEKELDLVLFLRCKGRLSIRPEVEKLLNKTLGLLNQFEDLYQEADWLKRKSDNRHIVIALPSSFTSIIAPSCLKRMWERYPEARFQLITGKYSMIETEIENDRADIGFSRIYDKSVFQYKAIDSGTPYCVIPSGHPLSNAKTIKATDLKGESMVLIGKGSETRKDIDTWFENARITPEIKLEVHSVESACTMVSNGFGISIANSTLLKGLSLTGVNTVPILDLPRYQYGIIQRAARIVSEEKVEILNTFITTLQSILLKMP